MGSLHRKSAHITVRQISSCMLDMVLRCLDRSGYEENEILDSQASDTQVIAKFTGEAEPEEYTSDAPAYDGYEPSEPVHDRWHELMKQQLEGYSDGVDPYEDSPADDKNGEYIGE